MGRPEIRDAVGGSSYNRVEPQHLGGPGAPRMLCGGMGMHMRAISPLFAVRGNGKAIKEDLL